MGLKEVPDRASRAGDEDDAGGSGGPGQVEGRDQADRR